jgi:hypothetical protein
MYSAETMTEVLSAAARREAKLAWIAEQDVGLYRELIDTYQSTKDIMWAMYD